MTQAKENFRTYVPAQYEGLVNRLIEKKVIVQAKEPTASPWAALLLSWAPILLLIGFWIFFMRQVQSGGNKALSFGKSKAKLSSSAQKKVTFRDVAGAEEAEERAAGDHRVPARNRRSSRSSAAAFRRACC